MNMIFINNIIDNSKIEKISKLNSSTYNNIYKEKIRKKEIKL